MSSPRLMLFGPLPIRILAGIAFLIHGLPKLSDIAGTQGFLGNVTLPPFIILESPKTFSIYILVST